VHKRRQQGFTLVELMVTVAVVAILAVIAFPNFQSTLRANRIAAAHNELLALLNLARSDGVRNNRGGGVCGSSTGAGCDGNWAAGVMAFADSNGNGSFDAGETVLRFSAINPNLGVTGPSAQVAFDPRGRRRAAADQTVVMQPLNCGSAALRREVTINASGQVMSTSGNCQ